MSRPRTAPRLIVLVAACAMALTGCLQADYRAEISEDGSGSVDIEVALGEQLSAMYAAAGQMGAGDLADQYDPIIESLPPDLADKVVVEALPEDRGVGLAVHLRFDDPAQLDEIYAAMNSGASAGGGASDQGAPSFRREGDGWRFDMDFAAASSMSTGDRSSPDDLGDPGDLGDFGDLGDSGDLGGSSSTSSGSVDLGDAFGEMAKPRIDVRVELPGHITDADPAAHVDGNVATWSSEDGDLGKIHAVSAPGGGTPRVLVFGLLGLLGVAVAAGVVVLVLRSRSGGATPPQSPPPGLPMTAPPSMPPAAPVAPDATAQMPGWHPDPTGQAAQRWWDGTSWTEHTA